MSVGSRIATPDGKRRYVRTLFATIAKRYDLITRLLSYGQDRRWKRRLVDLAGAGLALRTGSGPGLSADEGSGLSTDARPGLITVEGRPATALDLATGTGDIAFLLEERGVRTVGLDVTFGMIALARAKRTGALPRFLVGDMMTLPFPSASFDVVTTGYGLRNVPDLGTAIDEIARVLKPDGHALSLDFNRPQNAFVRAVYLAYLTVVGGALGWILHRDADTYRYIPASIRNYPGAEAVARMMTMRGFTSVRHYPVLGGLMAIHHARK